jgi:hypothetical protein
LSLILSNRFQVFDSLQQNQQASENHRLGFYHFIEKLSKELNTITVLYFNSNNFSSGFVENIDVLKSPGEAVIDSFGLYKSILILV